MEDTNQKEPMMEAPPEADTIAGGRVEMRGGEVQTAVTCCCGCVSLVSGFSVLGVVYFVDLLVNLVSICIQVLRLFSNEP